MEHDMVIIDMPLDGRNTPLNNNYVLPSTTAPSPLGVISFPPTSPQSSVLSFYSGEGFIPYGVDSINVSTLYLDALSPNLSLPSVPSADDISIDNGLGISEKNSSEKSSSPTSEIQMHTNKINQLDDNIIIEETQQINDTDITVIEMTNVSELNCKDMNNTENLTINIDAETSSIGTSSVGTSDNNKNNGYNIKPRDIKIFAVGCLVLTIIIIIICAAATS